MKNLEKMYPNVIKNLPCYWIDMFEESKNEVAVEKLFSFLEREHRRILYWADAQYEDLEMSLITWEKDDQGKPYVEIYFEKLMYDPDWNEWVRSRKYPLTLRVSLKGTYKGTTDEINKKKIEDFLESLPEDLDQCLV